MVDPFPDYRLVLIDPRGHGESDKPRDPKAHRIEEYRDDVHALLDATRTDRAVIWGISDGGKIGCAVASAFPDRVSAIIDHDGLPDRDLCESSEREERLDLARTIRTLGLSTWLAEGAPSAGFSPESQLIKEHQTADSEMAALELEEWTHWKGPVSILPRLKLPILRLISGTQDKDLLDRLQSIAVETSEFQVFPGINHLQICGEPRLTLGIMRDFLSRVTKVEFEN